MIITLNFKTHWRNFEIPAPCKTAIRPHLLVGGPPQQYTTNTAFSLHYVDTNLLIALHVRTKIAL